MRSAALLLLATLLLLAWPVTPAQASESVEGDGFRFRLPPEFVDIRRSKGAGQAEIQKALELLGGMDLPGIDLDMRAYVRQRGAEPDALLFAMSMRFDGKMAQGASDMTLDAFEAGLREAQRQIEAQGELIEISRIRRILVSAGRPALELEINIDEPERGPLNCMRALYVVEPGNFCVLGMQSMRKNGAEDAMLWRAVVTSFRLDEKNSLLELLMRYGPFVLGGLVILIALIFLKKSSSKQLIRPVLSTTPGGGESGFSRALDGLPLYGPTTGAPPGPPTGVVSSNPEDIPAAAPANAPAPASGGFQAPTIPRAAVPPPEGVPQPTEPAFAAVPERAPAPAAEPAAAPGGPSGLPRKLPPAAPPTVSSGGPTQPPAVAERVEIGELAPGTNMPTNVAMRDAQPKVPEADTADQVLSRLMGLDEAEPVLEGAEPPEKKAEGARIQRNSDFLA